MGTIPLLLYDAGNWGLVGKGEVVCDCGLGMGIGDVLCVRFMLVRLLGRGFMLT